MKGWKIPANASRFLLILPVIIAVAFVLFLRFSIEPNIYDDAYITFRYARNLAEGQGFVYNAGEHVLGTSTPLYAMLLACGAKIFGSDSLPWFATRFNILCDAIGVVLIFLIARRLRTGSAVAFGLSLLFAVNPIGTMNSLAGMETSFYILLILATAYALLEKRLTALGILSALLILTRPDGLIFAALAIFAAIVQHKKLDRKSIQGLIAFSLPLLIWILFSGFYFGSVFPQTMNAKQLAYPDKFTWVQLLKDFSYHGSDSFFGLFGQSVLKATALYFVLFLIGSVHVIRSNRAAWIVVAFPIAYALAFSLGAPMLFQWYIVPPIPFWLLTGVLGILAIVMAVVSSIPKIPENRHRQISQALVLVILLGGTAYQFTKFNWGHHRIQPPWPTDGREETYQAVAESLGDIIPESARIATPEIGTFGFYHPARILDTVGLVSPEALDYYPLAPHRYKWNSAIPSRLIQDEKPEFIVAFDGFMRNSLLKSPGFLHGYREIKKFPYQLWESTGPQVYQRKTREEIDTELNKSKTLFLGGRYKEAMNRIQDALYFDQSTRADALHFLDEDILSRVIQFSPDKKRVKPGFFRDFVPIPDEADACYLLDQWGRVYRSNVGEIDSFSEIQLVDLDVEAVDIEQTPFGCLIVDSAGYLYPLDSTKILPEWTAISTDREINQCVAFEYSTTEGGFYLLDINGRLHWRGKILKSELIDQKRLWKQPIARDFAISEDGQHFYIANCHGVIVHQGPESGAIKPSQTYNWGRDIIRRIEFLPDCNALAILAGNGAIYLYADTSQDFDAQLPDPGWNYLVAFNFHPKTKKIIAMDSNGKIYDSIPVSLSKNDVSNH